jgi:hypothetical protein
MPDVKESMALLHRYVIKCKSKYRHEVEFCINMILVKTVIAAFSIECWRTSMQSKCAILVKFFYIRESIKKITALEIHRYIRLHLLAKQSVIDG